MGTNILKFKSRKLQTSHDITNIIEKFEYSPTDHICDNNGQNII